MSSRLVALLIAIAITTRWANAQSTFGTIVGVVKDPGELVVPGAEIKLSSLDDQSVRTTTSDSDGAFQFMNVKPGRYEISVHAGFAAFKVQSVRLEARQTLREEVSLKVASASETIEVGDRAPMINTESATLADTKDFVQVSQLPVNYRGATTSSMAVLTTVPGTQQDANGNVSVGGGLPSQVQYSVDGASTVNIRQNGALANMNPSSELISEFKVSQFNNNAEFVQLGDITIATKSGGEHFHGSAFEYMQNSVLDATTFGFTDKPHKAFNTFGGSLGGPLKIPGLRKGTPHTFFFADYEGNRRRLVTPLFLNVPTADMRGGDLTGLSCPSGGSIIDPTTGQPFPNNKIPSNRINPVATALFQNYLTQLPNSSAAGANYLQQSATPSNTNGYDIRVDHTLTSKQSLYARWSAKNLSTTVPNALLPSDHDSETDRNLILSHNYAITNTLVNEVRFGVSLFRLGVQFPIEGATAVQQLGLVGLDPSDHPTAAAFPTFNFNDGTGFTPIGRDKAGATKSKTIQFTDNLNWARGKHTLKVGVDVRRVAYADIESFGGSDDFGAFTFSSATFTGNAFADFLLGLPAKTYIAQSGPDVLAHTVQTGLYGQDEWRVTRRLTMNFGMRWQALPPFVSPLNNLTAFDKRNGGVIIPDHNVPVQGFLESINACSSGPYCPYRKLDLSKRVK